MELATFSFCVLPRFMLIYSVFFIVKTTPFIYIYRYNTLYFLYIPFFLVLTGLISLILYIGVFSVYNSFFFGYLYILYMALLLFLVYQPVQYICIYVCHTRKCVFLLYGVFTLHIIFIFPSLPKPYFVYIVCFPYIYIVLKLLYLDTDLLICILYI